MATKPLSGVRIADLSQVILGPYATWLLARQGADVIKIEPTTGDMGRGRRKGGYWFHAINEGKRSVAVDLKDPDGRQVLLDLLATSDVLVENYRPGVMRRLGLDPEQLCEAYPRLLYTTARGFREGTENSGLPAVDLTIQAITGFMSSTGEPDGPPVRTGAPITDYLAGTHVAQAVVAALFARERTGRGGLVQVAMYDCLLPTVVPAVGRYLTDPAAFVHRTGNRNSTMDNAPYGAFPAQDGYVIIASQNNAHWAGLVKAMGRTDLLADARFASPAERSQHVDEIERAVSDWTSSRRKDDIFRLLADVVPTAPVRSVPELLAGTPEDAGLVWLEHEQLGQLPVPHDPFVFDLGDGSSEPDPRRTAPELGAHSTQILTGELGYSAERVAALVARGVIRAGP